MVTEEYSAPVLQSFGSVTKLTQWNNEKMVCSDATYYSGTWWERWNKEAILPPGGSTHSGWYDYAAENDCEIYYDVPLP